MKRFRLWLVFSLLLVGSWLIRSTLAVAPAVPAFAPPAKATKEQVLKQYATRPLAFEMNQGQTAQPVRALSRQPGYTLFLTAQEAVLQLPAAPPPAQSRRSWGNAHQQPRERPPATLRLSLLKANPAPTISGLEPLPGRVNYYRGKEQSQWRTGVAQYAKVAYRDVYPGISLLWYGTQQQLEYDFVLQPQADPRAIKLAFTGARKMRVEANGDLVLTTANGEVRQRQPVAYQERAGQRQPVAVRYVIARGREVRFAVGQYDATQPLVIDPVLLYASFFGGTGTGFANNPGTDFAQDATLDDDGNLYLTGSTASVDFPLANPVQATIGSVDGCCDDAFITKLSPTGVVFSTYLGGSRTESGNAITLDKDGHVIVSGQTVSDNFPTTLGAFQTRTIGSPQAFVTKLDRSGGLVFSTYLAGGDRTSAYAVTTDASGNVYVAGATRAFDFPLAKAYQSEKGWGRNYDGFITKLDPLGTGVLYSTYLGGVDEDGINAIKVDQAGNIYVAGATSSPDFPVQNALQDYWVYDYDSSRGYYTDAFVTKLSADGQSLIYSTYLGHYKDDYVGDLEIDEAGNVYLAGETTHGLAGESGYPAVSLSPARQALVRKTQEGNVFVVKLDATGTQPLFVNYFGPRSSLYTGPSLALDAVGMLYVAGGIYRSPLDPFTVTADALQLEAPPANNGAAFLTIFDTAKAGAASLRYSTLMSGAGSDGAVAVLLDKQRNIYLVGHSTYYPQRGGTNDFPLLNPPYKATFGPATDVFLAKFSALLAPPPSQADTLAPLLSLTAPTTGAEYATTSPKITLRGTASDNVGVRAVTWTMDESLSTKVTGTNNWTIPDVYLQRGKNKITVTAADAAGNLSTAMLTVTYQSEYLIETYAGRPYSLTEEGFTGDGGLARLARFREIYSLAMDKSGTLYVADILGTRIRKITPDGIIQHVAGLGGSGFAGDGGPATAARIAGSGTIAVDKNGNLFIADPWNHRVRKVTPDGIILTVAGSGPVWPQDNEGQHSGDGGPATQARLMWPSSVAVDEAGNLYIADAKAQRIRKVNPAGVITTMAGTGTAGNTGDGDLAVNARLEEPGALAADAQGNVYFGQATNEGGRVIRKISTDGKINRIAGNGKQEFGIDGGTALAIGISVNAIALDGAGNLFFIDGLNYRLRRLNASGFIDTLAGRGEYLWYFNGDGGAASAAHLRLPYSVAVDGKGNIYVAEISGNTIRRLSLANASDAAAPVVTITSPSTLAVTTPFPLIHLQGKATDSDGVFQVNWRNERGGAGQAIGLQAWQVDHVALQPGLNPLTITATDAAGNVGTKQIVVEYQPDTAPPTISLTSPTTAATYNTDAVFVRVRGTASDNAGIAEIQWRTDRGDNGYVTGTANAWRIDRLVVREGGTNLQVTATDYAGNRTTATLAITHTPEYVMYTYAGGNSFHDFTGNGDGGPARQATFLHPQGMAVDGLGNIYVNEGQFNAIRKITPDGTIRLFREMPWPGPMAGDQQGNLFVFDSVAYRILKITPDGKASPVVGNGEVGPIGDNVAATATPLSYLTSLAVDSAGNLFLANSQTHRVHKVSAATGRINLLAGTGVPGFSGDGGLATAAQLSNPIALALDRQGNVYFADQNKIIRRVSPDGIIRTIAGVPNFGQGFSGDGGLAMAAQFNNPLGLVVDDAGNLFVSDAANSCVRRIKPDGIVSTIAGINPYVPEARLYYTRGEYSAATWATMSLPTGIGLNAQGTLFVLDQDHFRVRAITPYSINTRAVASVSSASYAQAPVAAEAIVSAFGTNLATATWPAPQVPLPTWLGGTTVKVKDSQGIERLAPLFYVSATQVNYQLPKGTAAGTATVTITSGAGQVATGTVQVAALAPGLFSATADGKGLAAALVQRVKADGSQVYEQVTQFDAAQNKFVALPIDVSKPNEQPYLLLYGTGWRARSALANVQVTIGGVACDVLYAGAQGAYVGLDQLNVKLPPSLAGRQEVEVLVIVDGKPANSVRVHLK